MADEALAAPAQSPLQAIADNFAKLTARQKIAGAIALAAAIALFTGVWLWSKQPSYSILFANLADKDGGAIIAALQQQNVPYKVDGGGSVILVPDTQVSELRLRMAQQGLPKGGMVGFEVMDTQKIGMSQFNEQINYQRALEGELSRTIHSLSAVSGARVHLAIPKTNSFLRDVQKPTASVVVNLYPGRRLEAAQIAGIVHLVAASVPQLETDDVSVIDQNGNLLTRSTGSMRQAGLNPNQLNYVEEVEDGYMRRIDTILQPILGEGNYRAQVTAQINFDATEQTSETYKPNPPPDTAIRSQQTSENISLQPNASGVPGALTNQPPVPATAPVTSPETANTSAASQTPQNTAKATTTNYELDKTISHTRRSLGSVKRLSVALVLNHKTTKDAKGKVKTNPLPDEEVKKITDLVREAIGYDQQRGDSINVANTPFNVPEKEEVAELPFWKNPEIIAMAKEALRYLVLLGIIGFVVLGVIRPLMRTLTGQAKADEEGGEMGSEEEEKDKMKDLESQADEASMSPELLEAELAKMSLDKKISRAKEIAAKDPRLVAQLLKEWLRGENTDERR